MQKYQQIQENLKCEAQQIIRPKIGTFWSLLGVDRTIPGETYRPQTNPQTHNMILCKTIPISSNRESIIKDTYLDVFTFIAVTTLLLSLFKRLTLL